jgi:CHAT domain-containing protein
VTLGDVSLAQGRISAAVTYYKTALAYQRKSYGDSNITVNILAKLGLGLQDEGFNSESIVTFRETVQVAKNLPNGSRGALTADQLSNYAEAAIAIAPSFTKREDQQGLFAEVFEAMQLQNSSVIDKTIALATARLKVSDPEISKLVDDLQSNERLRDAAKSQLAAETSLSDDQRSKVVEDNLNQQITERSQKIEVLRAEIEKKYPEYADLVKGRVIKVHEVQSYLSPKEAIATFLLGNQASYIQLVTRENISLVQIPMTMDQITDEIKNLRKGLEVQRGTVNEFDLASSNNLYKNIFGKLENELDSIDHLVVIPTGPLASIPFGVLVRTPIEKGNYIQANWLANRYAITHAPSLASFYSKRSSDPIKSASKPFLGFGNPVLGDFKAEANLAPTKNTTDINKNNKKVVSSKVEEPKEVTQVPPHAVELCRTDGPIPSNILTAMPSLPDTALELQQIGKLVGGGKEEIYQGQQANESNLRNLSLIDYRVIYFATHGLLPGELRCQSEPAIVLSPAPSSEKDKFKHSDGLIDASEISQFKLNADLVVLSACNTAGGNGKFGGEALSGLTEAFFFAGAQNMLVSHWSVPSSATMKLMTSMFNNLGPKLENGTASSLQKAQQQMIKNTDTAHPVFWGAFVLIGDGAESGTGVAKTDKLQAKLASSEVQIK